MNNSPKFKGFTLIGMPTKKNPIIISNEEYEAIRLCDLALLNQVEAARIMEISRPAYTRIYRSARRKIAEAFVLGNSLLFQGGNVQIDSYWYSCRGCGSFFNQIEKEGVIKNCTLCGSADIEQYKENSTRKKVVQICVCPKCGAEKIKSLGIPCRNEICTECNCQMMRKGTSHYNRIINTVKKQ